VSTSPALPSGNETDPPARPLPDLDRLPADALLEAADLASLMGCSIRHIRRLSLHELRPLRIGSLVRWRVASVRTYLRDLERRARR
jgi:hypothetical protein